MSMTKLRNKVSRNGFDLSRKNLFTAKIGELLPVATIECLPDDVFNIDMAWFTRTQPINTAAYTRMREYYDWYFVPTYLLWDKFNTFITQMTDNNQKATSITGNVKLSTEHPYFTYDQIANYINNVGTEQLKNFFGFNRADLSCKLLHYLDYGDFTPFRSSMPPSTNNVKLNPFPLLAYQKIYQDFIRDSQWEMAYAPACNINYISGAVGSLNLPISEIDRHNENMFDLRYCNWNKDYFMGLLPSAQYGDAASISLDANVSLGFQPGSVTSERFTIKATTGNNSDLSSDYFVGVQPTSNNQIVSPSFYKAVNGELTPQQANLGLVLNLDIDENMRLRKALGLNSATITGANSLSSAFTILALRQAEAKQKWSEITQSQHQDYKSQMAAHWDADVSDAYSDRCKYIGGCAGDVDIQAVTNQNLTGDNDANIAGRGQGGARGSINFKAPVHGYLMCIYHCVPLLDYSTDGIKRQNLKTSVFDYAIPEFDATGMVSVPLIELSSSWTGTSPETLLGYAPRYIDYKTGYDLCHGAFFNGGLEQWVAPINRDYIAEYLESLGSTIESGVFNYHFFKVPPSVVNNIFGFDATSESDTDQLLINAGFDIKAVRKLDRNGLPY